MIALRYFLTALSQATSFLSKLGVGIPQRQTIYSDREF
jgi:hypothetical protein